MSESPTPARSRGDLDEVRRCAERLLRVAPVTPLWLRVRCGDTAVEIAWPADGNAPSTREASRGDSRQVGGVGDLDRARDPYQAGSGRSPGPGRPPLDGQPESRTTPELRYILAPTVGTFYHAAEPGERPFVTVGQRVEPGQQVGILESMKLMNPIEAEIVGKVTEVLVADASPVEFGQRLIAVAPADAIPD